MIPVLVPPGLHAALDEAWHAAKDVPGFLLENEARFLGMMAACAPRHGVIVEIGSFKGKSAVMLGSSREHYGFGPIVAIDPAQLPQRRTGRASIRSRAQPPTTSSSRTLNPLESRSYIEVHRAFSTDVAKTWNRPIRLLWIDGDHSYPGAKADFDGFMPALVPGGFVAMHDALHEFAGPIRVFVEDILRSNRFGASGFVNSIAWSQYRPDDSFSFRHIHQAVEPLAAKLLPFVADDHPLDGLRKLQFKLARSRVPRTLPTLEEWTKMLNAE